MKQVKRANLFPEQPFGSAGSDNRNDKLATIDNQAMKRLEEVIKIGGVIERRSDDNARQVLGMDKTGCGILNEGADIDLANAVGEFGVSRYEMVGDGFGGHDDIGATSWGKGNDRPVRGN